MTPKSGRVIAWLSFLLGIGVSIAGNVGHAASDGMKPGEWAGAAFWPLALMLTIEILTRVNWQPGKRWTAARIAGLILVAAVAAILSYRHLAGLMTYWGEDWANAHLGPLAVDGLMLVAATALLSISHESKLPIEWQGTPEEISAKAFERGAHAERVGAEALAEFKENLPAPGSLPWDDPKADPVADLQAAKERYAQTYDVHPGAVAVDVPEALQQFAEPKPEPQKLHIVNRVSASVSEEAALQAWIDSGRTMSSSQVAEMIGTSKSTAHRRMKTWPSEGRRIQR
jgi:hypothetical protein